MELKGLFQGYLSQMKANTEQLQDMLTSSISDGNGASKVSSPNGDGSQKEFESMRGRSGRNHVSDVPLRPTTSRGKPHPSPNEFFDYVVPSPVCKSTMSNVLKSYHLKLSSLYIS